MGDLKRAQNAALQAKLLYISRGVKGYFFTVKDYLELINALKDPEE